MLLYAAPVYVGLSCLLSLIYSCMECIRDKGKFDNATKSILCAWVLITIFVGFIVGSVSGEVYIRNYNTTHIIIALILASVTLCVSSCVIYWS